MSFNPANSTKRGSRSRPIVAVVVAQHGCNCRFLQRLERVRLNCATVGLFFDRLLSVASLNNPMVRRRLLVRPCRGDHFRGVLIEWSPSEQELAP